MLYNRNDLFIGGAFRRYGEFSEGELTLLRQMLPRGGMVVDVGANIGAITVPLALHLGDEGEVVAIEPQRLTFQLLCANVALNSLTNVTALQMACGVHRGHIKVPVVDPRSANNTPGSLSLLPRDKPAPANEIVEIVPLDELNLQGVALIKIDVEGMEGHVLLGAEKLIRRDRPVLYVENDRDDRSAHLIGLIRDMGYRLWWDLPALVRHKVDDGETDLSEVISINMLAVPGEMHAEIEGEPVAGPDDTFIEAQKRYASRSGLKIAEHAA